MCGKRPPLRPGNGCISKQPYGDEELQKLSGTFAKDGVCLTHVGTFYPRCRNDIVIAAKGGLSDFCWLGRFPASQTAAAPPPVPTEGVPTAAGVPARRTGDGPQRRTLQRAPP
eukprot:gene8979-biopygen16691